MENTERPEAETEQTTPQGLAEVLSEGLSTVKENQESAVEKEEAQVAEEETTERAEDESNPDESAEETEEDGGEEEESTQAIELSGPNGEPLSFENEESFQKFIDENPKLKEGFMLKADHTRKTTELAQKRQELESKGNIDEKWTEGVPEHLRAVPDESSFNALKNIFSAYQTGNPQYVQNVNTLLQQAQQLIHGNQPPQSQQASVPPELQERLDRLEGQLTQKDKAEADRMVNDWLDGIKKKGAIYNNQVEDYMAHFLQFKDPSTGKQYSLDKAYDYALRELGLETQNVRKTAFRKADKLKKTTPKTPSSVSSTVKPEAKSIGDVLRQGAQELGS